MEQRRHSDYLRMIELIKTNITQQTHRQQVMLRMRQIIRRETSFIYGFTESIIANFDEIFRYLYSVAFLLLMASEYTEQLGPAQAYSFLAASIIATLIFLVAMLFTLI